MPPVTLARQAMATRFEIVLHGDGPTALRAAGEEALNEIDRLEAQLSLYRPASEIAHLNARAAREPVRVSPELFSLLQHAKKLHAETNGAFDITIAPLVRCWGFMNQPATAGPPVRPTEAQVAEAKSKVGLHLVHLDAQNRTVRFEREGVMLDLGAIGKGYAVEKAAEILREAGITSALIHGGTSTVYAIGCPPGEEHWKVAVVAPGADHLSPKISATVPLKDEGLSVSAVWGKSFQTEDQTYGHVLDPRTGFPVSAAVLAAVVLPSATETDALSTALLVAGTSDPIGRLRPQMKTLLISGPEKQFQPEAHGILLDSLS